MAPPKVRFLTKIYHPNIGAFVYVTCLSRDHRTHTGRSDKLGRICLDILKGTSCPLPSDAVRLTPHRQMVTRAPNPDGPSFNTGTSERTQPRRSPRRRHRKALQGGRAGRAAGQQGVDAKVRVGRVRYGAAVEKLLRYARSELLLLFYCHNMYRYPFLSLGASWILVPILSVNISMLQQEVHIPVPMRTATSRSSTYLGPPDP